MACEACSYPFEVAEIDWDGNVYGCCSGYFLNYSFGNIFEQPFDEIWNGEKAQKFRKQFVDEKFDYCDFSLCAKEWKSFTPKIIADYPKRVQLNYDSTCNARCIFCRKTHYHNDVTRFDEIMESVIIPILKNADLVNVTALGEVFASNYSKRLIQKIADTYSKIKFYVYTNGIECNEKNLIEYKLMDRVSYFVVSLPAMTKETYDKQVIDGKFDNVVKNIEFLGSLKRQNRIENLILNFVITSHNYHEMPQFAEFARKNNASVSFIKLNKHSGNDYIYDEIAVAEKFHPDHNKYLEVLKNPIFKAPHINKTTTFTTAEI